MGDVEKKNAKKKRKNKRRKGEGMASWAGAGDWETGFASMIFFMIFKTKSKEINNIIETRSKERCKIFD